MTDEKELEQKILDCLLIEGTYEDGNGYIDTHREGIDVMVKALKGVIQECEQSAYEQGRAESYLT